MLKKKQRNLKKNLKINNIQKFSFGLGGGVNAIKTDFFVWYLGAYYLTVLGLNPLLTGFALTNSFSYRCDQ